MQCRARAGQAYAAGYFFLNHRQKNSWLILSWRSHSAAHLLEWLGAQIGLAVELIY